MAPIHVSTLDGLYSALSKATGGETILLAGGNYGELFLGPSSKFGVKFPSTVTIQSADPDDPAVFTRTDVRDAANLTFDGITFDYHFTQGDPNYLRPFSFSGGENLTVRNSVFDGDLARGVSAEEDGLGYAIGLSFRDVKNAVIENNEIFDFYRGVSVADGINTQVLSNNIHSIRMDGMNFVHVEGVRIEKNWIHDFNRSVLPTDHADMIQFWTDRSILPSTGIVIRGNFLDIGSGDPTQSIFMRNEQVDRGLAGQEMFYRDVLIEENVIVNGHLHGITVGETAGLTIRNNSVLHRDGGHADGLDQSAEIPRINVSATSTNVLIAHNAVSEISGWSGQSGWELRSNAFIQDQDANSPGFYGEVFVSSSMLLENGHHDFVALPGGMLDILKAGASANLVHSTDGAPVALINATGTGSSRLFDAGYSLAGPDGLPADTEFFWSFSDGHEATGRRVDHRFGQGGVYEVLLTMRTPDGTVDSQRMSLAIDGPRLLSMGAQGQFIAFDAGQGTTLAAGAAQSADGLAIGKTGAAAVVKHAYIKDLLHSEEFEITFNLRGDGVSTKGELFRIHTSLLASVSDGEISLQAWNSAGHEIRLKTVGARLDDGNAQDIRIALSDGILAIKLGGQIVAETTMSGTLLADRASDLTFGNPWNQGNFTGLISSFEVNLDVSQYDSLETSLPAPAPAPVLPILIDQNPDDLLDLPPSGRSSNSQWVSVEGATLIQHGKIANLDRSSIASLLRRDTDDPDRISLSFSLETGSDPVWGEIFRLPGSMIATVRNGEFVLKVWSADGSAHILTTTGAGLGTPGSHDVSIELLGNQVSVSVGNNYLGDLNLPSSIRVTGGHDFVFSPAIGQANGANGLTEFIITRYQSESAGALNDILYLLNDDDAGFGLMPGIEWTTRAASAIELDATGNPASLPRDFLSKIFQLDTAGRPAFEIDLELKADSASSAGEVMRLHGSFIALVDDRGELDLRLWSKDGVQTQIKTNGARLDDTRSHEIRIEFSNGQVTVMVDGGLRAQAAFEGPLASLPGRDLQFGNPWGQKNFEGHIMALDLHSEGEHAGRSHSGTQYSVAVGSDEAASAAYDYTHNAYNHPDLVPFM